MESTHATASKQWDTAAKNKSYMREQFLLGSRKENKKNYGYGCKLATTLDTPPRYLPN
jgi:hypothetical protein